MMVVDPLTVVDSLSRLPGACLVVCLQLRLLLCNLYRPGYARAEEMDYHYARKLVVLDFIVSFIFSYGVSTGTIA